MPPLLHNQQTYPPHFQMRYDTTHILHTNDPNAVDFRAFYPYTPNEVKHRKRTTSAQLKVLETVFKRDTKPNASLRNELAHQLDMTTRGVQVWFQNRRAKEKTKSVKATGKPVGGKGTMSPTSPTESSTTAAASFSQSPVVPKQEDNIPSTPPADGILKPSLHCKPVSPPQLHLITDVSSPTWQNSPVEPPPDSATFLSHNRASLFGNPDLYGLRRGSLPVNALFPQSSNAALNSPSSSIEWFDPLSRRRSVDASLQRLASNPYAPIARTKNSALFGPRFGVAPAGRFNNRVPNNSSTRSALHHHHYPSVPHVNIRRSSMDSRRLGLMLRTTALSPAPMATPYINSRASLPDGNLYAMSSRPVGSPIPGPLPSPNFSFGAASTPSMASPSSADSERNSPDSLRSFSFPSGDDHEDAGGYDVYSRFGSIVSIATSESSISSSYFPELAATRIDQGLTGDLHNGSRRNSCSPGQFLEFSELDTSAQYGLTENNPMGYPQEDYGITRPQGIVIPELAKTKDFSSPTTTTSNNASHGLDSAAAPSISVPSTVPISRSSELAFALQGRLEKSTPQDGSNPYLGFGAEHSSGDLTMISESASLMSYGTSEGDSTQGSYSTTFSEVYSQDGHNMAINTALFQAYNDPLNASAVSPIDNGVTQNTEAFTAYS